MCGHDKPEHPVTIDRNDRSRSTRIAGHDKPEQPVTIDRNTQIGQWIRSGLGMGSADTDGDGIADNVDNCKKTANPSQLDSDNDGYGNHCDADFNNDGYVNSLDLGMLRNAIGSVFGQPAFNGNIDMNGDGRINALDLGLFRARFGKPVGDQ
jgi:hypothetical protein